MVTFFGVCMPSFIYMFIFKQCTRSYAYTWDLNTSYELNIWVSSLGRDFGIWGGGGVVPSVALKHAIW
jgi:hypothetical protein